MKSKQTLGVKKVDTHAEENFELEKKYIFSSGNIQDNFDIVAKTLHLKNPKQVENYDIYYDFEDTLEAFRIAVRKRECDGKTEWTIKRPVSDITSGSKRFEKNFSSEDDVLKFLKENLNISISKLEPKIILKTNRTKYIKKLENGTLEISFDITTFEANNQNYPANYMIECELISGNEQSLEVINEKLEKLPFIKPSFQSKKEIALEKVNLSQEKAQKNIDENIKRFFITSPEYYEKLLILHHKKEEIKALKEKYGRLEKPIIVTVSGTPRAGKTTCIDNLFEFLKKADLETKCLDEPAGIVYATLKNKAEKAKLLEDRVGFVDTQYKIGQEYINKNAHNEVILCDRGVFDTFIWYDMYYNKGMMSKERYEQFLKLMETDGNFINYFYGLYCQADEAMRRDYLNSLSIEPRTTMTYDNIFSYNASLMRMLPLIKQKASVSELINTTNIGRMDASYMIAAQVLDDVKKIYSKRM